MSKRHKRSTPGAFGKSLANRVAYIAAQHVDQELVGLGFEPRLEGVYLVYTHPSLSSFTRFGVKAAWTYVDSEVFAEWAECVGLMDSREAANHPALLVSCEATSAATLTALPSPVHMMNPTESDLAHVPAAQGGTQ